MKCNKFDLFSFKKINMIKWRYFLKSLKLFLIGFWISCFTVLANSSVNADFLTVWWGYKIWQYDQNLQVSISSNWVFNTDKLWTIRPLFWVLNNTFLFWNNWQLYLYDKWKYYWNSCNWNFFVQWYVDGYRICDEFTGATSDVTNCWNFYFDQDNVGQFLSHVKNWDQFFYKRVLDWEYYCRWYTYQMYMCFSSSELHKTMCLAVYSTWWWTAQVYINNLTWSLDLDDDLSVQSVPSNFLGVPPWYTYDWSSEWSSTVIIDNTFTWDYVSSNCTYWQLFDHFNSVWLTKNLCYWWLSDFSLRDPNTQYSVIPWTWLTLWQIVVNSMSTWDTPFDWFSFWHWLYVDRYNNSYNDMWSSYPAVYRTWFDIYNRYWWNQFDFNVIYEACILMVSDVDLSSTYKWQYFKSTCSYMQNQAVNWWWNYWQSGTNVIWVNRNWVWNLSWWKTYNDWSVFIQDFFNLLKSKLKTDYNWGAGALPTYIIMFLLAFMLFKFLRK